MVNGHARGDLKNIDYLSSTIFAGWVNIGSLLLLLVGIYRYSWLLLLLLAVVLQNWFVSFLVVSVCHLPTLSETHREHNRHIAPPPNNDNALMLTHTDYTVMHKNT